MIRLISLKIHAENPHIPLNPVDPYAGSAVTLQLDGVPPPRGRRKIEAVRVSVTTVSGMETSITATRVGPYWELTIPAEYIGDPGTVTGGVIVSASGTDELGNDVDCWIIGRGDLTVRDCHGIVTPGVVRQATHVYVAKPENPIQGDIAPASPLPSDLQPSDPVAFDIYFAGAWRSFGSGGGSSVVLDTAFPETQPETDTGHGATLKAIWEWCVAKFSRIGHDHEWTEIVNVPATYPPDSHEHTTREITDFPTIPTIPLSNALLMGDGAGGVTAARAGTDYSMVQESSNFTGWAVGADSSTSADYATRLYDFDEILGLSEGKWCVSGSGITPDPISTQSDFALSGGSPSASYVSSLFARDNTSLMSATAYIFNDEGTILDRAINAVTAGSLTIPAGFTDLVLRYTDSGTHATLSFADSAIVHRYGDAMPTENGEYLVSVTKIGTTDAYVRVSKIEEVV